MIAFVLLAISPVILFLILNLVRTWKVQHDPRQKEFQSGHVPKTPPDGFHNGAATGYTGPWIGKKFFAKTNTGINVLKRGGKEVEKFPFKTYVGKGLQDKNLDVIKIDYNLKKNSIWLRMILDEIVEVEPGKFLGKVHLKLIPGLPFTIAYFRLQK